MPKRLSIAPHLNISELEQLYKYARDGIESRQYQIIWLLAQGKKTEEVEEVTGYSRTWREQREKVRSNKKSPAVSHNLSL